MFSKEGPALFYFGIACVFFGLLVSTVIAAGATLLTWWSNDDYKPTVHPLVGLTEVLSPEESPVQGENQPVVSLVRRGLVETGSGGLSTPLLQGTQVSRPSTPLANKPSSVPPAPVTTPAANQAASAPAATPVAKEATPAPATTPAAPASILAPVGLPAAKAATPTPKGPAPAAMNKPNNTPVPLVSAPALPAVRPEPAIPQPKPGTITIAPPPKDVDPPPKGADPPPKGADPPPKGADNRNNPYHKGGDGPGEGRGR